MSQKKSLPANRPKSRPKSQSVAILGAKGRMGRQAVTAFIKAGWQVKAVAREWPDALKDQDAVHIECDARDEQALHQAVIGCQVIVNAVNPPYHHWAKQMPALTKSVISAAKAEGATVIIPANIYVFGEKMPPMLNERTPHLAVNTLGLLRREMEQAYRDAGVRTILLRAGDFLEGRKTGNWFDGFMSTGLAGGKLVYPGPLDQQHTWAYLPDVARAVVALADKRDQLQTFEDVGFPGYSMTGQQMLELLSGIMGRTLKVGTIPWWLLKAMGLFVPSIRGVVEMSYLWRTPHTIEAAKFQWLLPDFLETPAKEAFTAVVEELLNSGGQKGLQANQAA
ncbi:MAG: NmrA family NAD(P)-binding protein [Kordiimonadaceae bacterium]|nr:NmrA family NAD(P)-binding protein [Kordiimonadaceae bacterium]